MDRQTDSFLLTRPPCIQCSAVITDGIKLVNILVYPLWSR